MYAIIETGGKQYKVKVGQVFETEKLNIEPGKQVEYDALMIVDDKKVSIGKPNVKNTKVICEVVSHGKLAKIRVFKYKAKKRVKKTQGHRQQYTALKVLKIENSK